MSVQPPPTNQGAGFNSAAFPGGSGQTVNFPKAQGTLTLGQGVVWGDGTFQNSASGGGGASLTVEEIDGTPSVNNVTEIRVSNGTLTDNGGGVVTLTTGGGGVTNPLTADLDGGNFSINNVDTFSGLFGNFGEVNTETINDSAAVQYVNMGAVVAGNEYIVATIDPATTAEGSITIVSRCLDVGFKQTIVFTATAFRTRANGNIIVNLTESDTPIFEALTIGERSGVLFCTLRCSAPSSTWEIRGYMNQDDKGTGTYGSSWRLATTPTIAPGLTTFFESRLGFQGEGHASMSGDLDVRDGIQCSTLTCEQATANVSVTTNTVNTNELRDNGLGIIDTFSPLRMNNNDIQSAGIIGANAYAAAALGAIVSVGTPSAGPLFVDSGNNRIGINVAVPSEDLEIDGNIQLDSSGTNKIKFYDGTATTERAEIDAAASGTGGQLIFYTKEDPGSVTAKMTIQADGRVTITNRIEGVTVPVAGTDAANKDYVDSTVSGAGYVENPMTSDLNAGSFKITSLLDPVDPQDAATKSYVDSSIPTAGTNLQYTGTALGTNAPVSSVLGTDGTGTFVAATAGAGIVITGSTISAAGGGTYTDAQAVNAVQTCATNPVPQLQLSCGFAFAPPVLAPIGAYVIPQNVSIVHAFGGSTTLEMPSGVREGTVIMIRNENNVTLDVNPGSGQQIENYNLGSPGTPSYVAPSFIGNFQSVTYYLADLGALTWYVLPRP